MKERRGNDGGDAAEHDHRFRKDDADLVRFGELGDFTIRSGAEDPQRIGGIRNLGDEKECREDYALHHA